MPDPVELALGQVADKLGDDAIALLTSAQAVQYSTPDPPWGEKLKGPMPSAFDEEISGHGDCIQALPLA
jgi:hypothetical protein